MELDDLVEDPVGARLRLGITRVGRLIYKHGGTKAMSDVLERAAHRDERSYSYRADVISYAWEGIGSESDFWAP